MPRCQRCGFDAAVGTAECPLCRAPLAVETAAVAPIPWEDPAVGFPANLAATIRQSLFDPAAFFPRVAWEAPLPRPVLYLLLLTVVSALFTLLWTAAGVQASGFEEVETVAGVTREAFILLNFTLSPFVALVGLLLSTLILHLFAVMLAPERRGLGATARALCYATGPGLLTVVPWVGALAGTVWGIVLLVFGLRTAHRTTGGRAAAMVLVPTALFFGFVLGVLALVAVLAERLEGLPGGALPLP